MKKISFIALALFTCMAVFAQDPQLKTPMARSTFFGIKAGANWAKMDVDEYPGVNVNNKTSMHGGIFLNIPVGTTLNFQPELLYNGVGSKFRETSTVGTVTTTETFEQDLSYLSLPLMLQVRSSKGLFFELGPQASYLISAKQEGPGNIDTDNKDAFDKFDVAINGGLGFTTRVGFGVHARYSYGLSNVLEDGGGNNSPNDGPELKNRVLSVGLHYMFGANK
jgi:hypothetical protein